MKKDKENRGWWFCVVVTVFFAACGHEGTNRSEAVVADSMVYNLANKHQILLMNEATFYEHTGLYGASAFLIKHQGEVYAVTARHLIGEAGGVEPEMMPADIEDYLTSWKMYPRVTRKAATDTVKIGKPTLDYTLSKQDVLLLPVENSDYEIFSLNTNFELPKSGQKLYVIGCPYSEAGCRQNVYEVTVDSYDPASATIYCLMKETMSISGFSGAPLLDANGNAVGVVVSGGSMEGINFIGATAISEIQKIR